MSDDCCPDCRREDCPALLPSGGDSQLCALQNCHRATVARAERAEAERDKAHAEIMRLRSLMEAQGESVGRLLEDHRAQVAALDAELARLRDAQRWRSVVDEPPPYKTFVLVYGDPCDLAGFVAQWRGDGFELHGGREAIGVTHWLPLPAGPKEPTK